MAGLEEAIDKCGVTSTYLLEFIAAHPEIEAEDLFTWEVVENIIKPMTSELKLSMVALAQQQEQDVKPATVFVSHAYNFKFSWAVASILQYEEEHRPEGGDALPFYFWFDPFSLNQHSSGVVSSEDLKTTFGESITEIGHALILLAPWQDPIPLKRAWCLFEMVTAIERLPPEAVSFSFGDQTDAFLIGIRSPTGHAVAVQALAKIDAQHAQAREQADMDAIRAVIEDTVGYHGLNSKVATSIREWVCRTGSEEVARLKPTDAYGAAVLQSVLGLLMESIGHESALRMLQESLETRIEHSGADDPAFFGLYIALANLSRKQGDNDGCIRYHDLAADLNARVHTFTTARLLNSQGLLSQQKGNIKEALTYLTEARSLYNKYPVSEQDKERKENKGNTLVNLGNTYLSSGENILAKEMYTAALDLCLTHKQPDDPSLGIIYNNLGNLCISMDEPDDAVKYCNMSLLIFTKVLAPGSSAITNVRGNLGRALLARGSDEDVAKGRQVVEDTLVTLTSPPHSLNEDHHWIKKFRKALQTKGDDDQQEEGPSAAASSTADSEQASASSASPAAATSVSSSASSSSSSPASSASASASSSKELEECKNGLALAKSELVQKDAEIDDLKTKLAQLGAQSLEVSSPADDKRELQKAAACCCVIS